MVLEEDVGPDCGVARCDAGHIAKSPRGELQEYGVLARRVGRLVHEGSRQKMGHVARQGDEAVVVTRRHRDDVGTDLAQMAVQSGVDVGGSALCRSQYPRATLEEIGRAHP